LAKSLDHILLTALQKNSGMRYPNAGALAEALEQCLAGKFRFPSPRQRFLHHFTGRRGRLAGALAIIILVAAIATWRHFSHPLDVFQQIELLQHTNSLSMRFVRIDPRTFLMGSPVAEDDRDPGERQHDVRLTKTLWFCTTPVTQAQFQAVMGRNPSDPNQRGDDFPVNRVTWADADEFCRKLSELEHRTYRLPTEAEWECACRAGDTSPFDRRYPVDQIAWTLDNSGGKIHAVARKLPNAWGIHDMHGNVGQWCLDYTSEYPARATGVSIDPIGNDRPLMRVCRGGGYTEPPSACRSAARVPRERFFCSPALGFRVVIEEPPATAGARPIP
jgi:formylglycine-generating enzyme required for sulfatase activity